MPLISKLSIDTTKSLYIAYADLIVTASSVNTDSVKWFFLAPIWLYGNRVCSSAMSVMWSIITFFRILLKVFSKTIGQ